MKKIAILTINDYNNYGNRLQNYATQEVIRSFGFQVETIIYERNANNTPLNFKDKLQKFFNLQSKDKYDLIKTKASYFFYKKIINNRIKVIKQFTHNYIYETNFSISINNIPEDLHSRYDFFITGSDQVWNPKLGFGTSIDFLTFAPIHKRIAYAPSFGISEIPQNYIKNYQKWISEIPYLSVREQVGADIIKKLTGRESIVLIDPTLMLSKEKWVSISKSVVKKPHKYLLVYFLGKISYEIMQYIQQISFEYNLEVVYLASLKDKARYIVDPSEFIDYFNSANIIFTDSFHGTIFSILFEKPFIVFDRLGRLPSMNSRIDTLLAKFKLECRKWENIKNNNDIFNIAFSHVQLIIEEERNKALDFLRNALNVRGEN